MTVKDGLIFARDKNGMVSIYKEEDATPENYQKVNRYRRASGNGSPGNNGFASHSMQPDAEGHLLLTDYEGKKIRVLDPALVNDDMANDASIDLDDLSLRPASSPRHWRCAATAGMLPVTMMPSTYTNASPTNGARK